MSGDEGIAKQIPKLFFIKSVHGIARDFRPMGFLSHKGRSISLTLF